MYSLTMEHAVLYIRVSTDEQAKNGVSLVAQNERLRAYCVMARLDILEVIRDEGVSAWKKLETRPGGKRLLSLVESGQATNVVALRLDRLFRNAEDALHLATAWEKRGVALHLVDMGGATMNTASAIGKMMLTMLAGFAEFERNLVSERTSGALRHKRIHGEAYGPVPFGYRRVGDSLKKYVKEYRTLERIRAWRAEGLTLKAIADRLNAEGVKTKHGKTWYPSTVRYLLTNELYQEETQPAPSTQE